jgi:glycosyltransferase involved in cell wall biosynthesis
MEHGHTQAGAVVKILVIAQLPQFVTGGAEFQASRLIGEWSRQGHEVICLGRYVTTRSVTIGEYQIRVNRIPMIDSLGRYPRGISYVLSLAFLVWKYRKWADVIYCRFLGEAAVTVALLKLFRLIRVPLVAVPASSGPEGDIGYLRSVPGHRALVRLLDKQCDAINLIAPRMKDDLIGFGFSGQNFSQFPNGIPIAQPRPQQLESRHRLITVCRLAPQKRLDLLLRALATVIQRHPNTRLCIVGDGPQSQELRSLAKELLLDQHVEFTGMLGPADVRSRLQSCDLFVLPSRYEGFSNAALEAMEAGLPVILSRCGGLDSYITPDMGWIVERDNTESLTDALLSALSLPRTTLFDMGFRARGLVLQKFDIAKVAQSNLQLFTHLHETYLLKDSFHSNET